MSKKGTVYSIIVAVLLGAALGFFFRGCVTRPRLQPDTFLSGVLRDTVTDSLDGLESVETAIDDSLDGLESGIVGVRNSEEAIREIRYLLEKAKR